MKEIVILSGKGGTGKTSIAAALAVEASRMGGAHSLVVADCDVDAADLHLVLSPTVKETHEFISGHVAHIDGKKCLSTGEDSSCSTCIGLCRFDAIRHSYRTGCEVDEGSCEGCGVCVAHCPVKAIMFPERRCGEWYHSDTRVGPFIHAALDARAENSGKLVTTVRKEARKVAEEIGAKWILVDGSPGTGCPVIASITGADEALIVTEPTVSGLHDLERVGILLRHFSIPFSVCVNKADVSMEKASEMKEWCERNSIPFLGMIGHDPSVTKAQIQRLSIVEYCERENIVSNVPGVIAGLWERLCR